MALPTRTIFAPHSMAVSKSPLIPIDRYTILTLSYFFCFMSTKSCRMLSKCNLFVTELSVFGAIVINPLTFTCFESEDDYYDDDYYDEEETEDEESARVKRSSQQSAPKKTFSKVVPINPTSSSRIKIMRPSDINDSTNVANEIKEGRLVIFDVGQIDNEEARRIVDFMSGAAYGVNGKVRRVSEGIFVAAPKNIDITGDTMKEHVKNGMDWNFM